MREIKYICDVCEREYPYTLLAGDSERAVLLKVGKKELCRTCLDDVYTVINNICQQKLQSTT